MLYARWCQIARRYQNQWALHELASGRRWSFADLAAQVEAAPALTEPIVYPKGRDADFVLATLQAWRVGSVVCPLEPEQSPPAVPPPPGGIVHLKITSASTGPARMIAFTADQLMADAENIIATMGLNRDWPNLAAISLAHSYGFSNLILPLLLHGIPLYLLDSSWPETLRRQTADLGPITLPGVPALWRAWLDAGVIPPQIQVAISAGAPLPPELDEAVFRKHRLKVHNFLGASECGGIAYDRSESPRNDSAYAGQTMENVRLTVGADGCLRVHSLAAGQSYWPEPDPALQNGCFATRDLAELDGDHIYLRGRAGDIIHVAGRKVAPEIIEQVLRSHPQVRECLVFGIPAVNAERTDIIVACVATREETVDTARLKQFAMERLPAWQVPREWRRVDSLQADQRGKLSRAQWKQWYLEQKTAKGKNQNLES